MSHPTAPLSCAITSVERTGQSAFSTPAERRLDTSGLAAILTRAGTSTVSYEPEYRKPTLLLGCGRHLDATLTAATSVSDPLRTRTAVQLAFGHEPPNKSL